MLMGTASLWVQEEGSSGVCRDGPLLGSARTHESTRAPPPSVRVCSSLTLGPVARSWGPGSAWPQLCLSAPCLPGLASERGGPGAVTACATRGEDSTGPQCPHLPHRAATTFRGPPSQPRTPGRVQAAGGQCLQGGEQWSPLHTHSSGCLLFPGSWGTPLLLLAVSPSPPPLPQGRFLASAPAPVHRRAGGVSSVLGHPLCGEDTSISSHLASAVHTCAPVWV